MSQYGRVGRGGGRNQYGITDDEREAFWAHNKNLVESTKNLKEDTKKVSEKERLTDFFNAFSSAEIGRKKVEAYFEKYPDAKVLTAGGYITSNSLENT